MPFIKPPFLNMNTPAARGLGVTAANVGPTLKYLLYGGAAGLQPSASTGEFKFTLPADYNAGDDIDVVIDYQFGRANAGQRFAVFAATIDDTFIADAPYSFAGGIVPNSKVTVFCKQRQDPTLLTSAAFGALGNMYNLPYISNATINRATATLQIPGVNKDTGRTSTTDYKNWGSQATPNAGHNINGGYIATNGPDVQIKQSAAFPPGTFPNGRSFQPTLSPTVNKYGFTEAVCVLAPNTPSAGQGYGGPVADGSGAAAIIGFPGYHDVPAGSKTLQPGDPISVVLWSYTLSVAYPGVLIYSVKIRINGTDYDQDLTQVYRKSLLNDQTGPASFVNGAPQSNGMSSFWLTRIFPEIAGTPAVGQVLTIVSQGEWEDATFLTNQWLRDGVAITGQTGMTYTVVSADGGHYISLAVTAHGATGTTRLVSNALGPVPDFMLLEGGGFILLEGGGKIELE